MRNSFFLGVYLLLTLFTSCTSGRYRNIPTFTVAVKDFENSITVDGFVEPVRMLVTTCPRAVDGVINYIVDDGAFVRKGDVICVIESQGLQRDYDEEIYLLERLEAEFNIIKANLNLQYTLLEAQVENNEANTKIANLDSAQLLYAPPSIRRIKEIELEKAAILQKRFDERLEVLDVINKAEIRRMELRIQRKEVRIETLRNQLEELYIKAPLDGMAMVAVNRSTGAKHLMGDPVFRNMPLVIIPELSEVKVKVWANETDYKYINVDDSVVYTFDAMPDNRAWGKIVMKSNAGVPYRRNSKVKVFEIEATVDSVLLMPTPGFTTNCRVIMKEIKDVLVVPHVAVFVEDSLKVVYVKNKKGFEMRPITTGLSSSKEVIVTSGLKENEEIALIRPIPSLTKNMLIMEDDSIVEEFE